MGYYYKRDEEKMSICSIYKSVSCLRKKKKWNYFVITVLYSTVQYSTIIPCMGLHYIK